MAKTLKPSIRAVVVSTGIALLTSIPLFFAAAQAHDFTFSWDDPTERTDGTGLNPDTELKSYQMRCQGPENVARYVDRAATTVVTDIRRTYVWVDAVQISGTYNCQLTAVDTGDRESDWSNVASVSKFAPPSAPTDLRDQ